MESVVVNGDGEEETPALLELDELGVAEVGDEEVVVVVVRKTVCWALACVQGVDDLRDRDRQRLTESVLELEELDPIMLEDDEVVVFGNRQQFSSKQNGSGTHRRTVASL